MNNDKIKQMEEKINYLKRVRVIAKERTVYKQYNISKLDRQILLNFETKSTAQISKRLKCHRSYVYATIEKFKDVYTKSEVNQK